MGRRDAEKLYRNKSIYKRILQGVGKAQLARKYNISITRVSQIVAKEGRRRDKKFVE